METLDRTGMRYFRTVEFGYGFVLAIYEDGAMAVITSAVDEDEKDTEVIAAIDGIETLVMSHYAVGIDIESEAYKNGVKQAFEHIANHYG